MTHSTDFYDDTVSNLVHDWTHIYAPIAPVVLSPVRVSMSTGIYLPQKVESADEVSQEPT